MEQRRGKGEFIEFIDSGSGSPKLGNRTAFPHTIFGIDTGINLGSDFVFRGTDRFIGAPAVTEELIRIADCILEHCTFIDAGTFVTGFIDACTDDVIWGFIDTGLIIGSLDIFTDYDPVTTSCSREALHRSHRCSRRQSHRADQ
jgi:hypothetical protein